MRATQMPCAEVSGRPGMDQVYPADQICTLPFYKDDYQTDMFDGTEFSYGREPSTPTIATLQWDIPLQGNQKDVRISNYDKTSGINSIYWRETLKNEIFDKGWLAVPTSTLTI